MADSVRSEDAYGQKVDRCLYNSMVKFVGGVGVGIVCSVLLFKRKPWPMILGAGAGLGMGVSDCNHEFKGTANFQKKQLDLLGGFPSEETSEETSFTGASGDASQTECANQPHGCRPLRSSPPEPAKANAGCNDCKPLRDSPPSPMGAQKCR